MDKSEPVPAPPVMSADGVKAVCMLNAYEERFQVDATPPLNVVYVIHVPFLYLVSSFINDGDGDEWNVYRKIAPSGRISWIAIGDIEPGDQLLTSYGPDRARFNLPEWSLEQTRLSLARANELKAKGISM